MPSEKIERVGRILAFGFGDRIAIGIIFGFIEGLPPAKLYECIINNTDLAGSVSNNNWITAKKYARYVGSDIITVDRFISELRKNRVDLMGVIVNTPGGMEWLDGQVKKTRQALGFDVKETSWTLLRSSE